MKKYVRDAIAQMAEINKAEVARRDHLGQAIASYLMKKSPSERRNLEFYDYDGTLRPELFEAPTTAEAYRKAFSSFVDVVTPEAMDEYSALAEDYLAAKRRRDEAVAALDRELNAKGDAVRECRTRWNEILCGDYLKVSDYIPGIASSCLTSTAYQFQNMATKAARLSRTTTPERMADAIRSDIQRGAARQKSREEMRTLKVAQKARAEAARAEKAEKKRQAEQSRLEQQATAEAKAAARQSQFSWTEVDSQ